MRASRYNRDMNINEIIRQAQSDQRAGINVNTGRARYTVVAEQAAYLNAYVKSIKTDPRAIALSNAR